MIASGWRPKSTVEIEFHSDALIDSKWKVTKSLKLPDTLRSGVYAVRLRAGAGHGLGEEYLVFFVRPKTPTGRIAFLIPTASYLAYANERLSFDEPIIQPVTGMTPILSEIDIELNQSEEFGLSTCDRSADGNGVCYSSYHRPIVNMRPKYRTSSMNIAWGLPADLSIIAWLDNQEYDYDVLTDEDLHREGRAALAPYKCIIGRYSPGMLFRTDAGCDRGLHCRGWPLHLFQAPMASTAVWLSAMTSLRSWNAASSVRRGRHGKRAPANTI